MLIKCMTRRRKSGEEWFPVTHTFPTMAEFNAWRGLQSDYEVKTVEEMEMSSRWIPEREAQRMGLKVEMVMIAGLKKGKSNPVNSFLDWDFNADPNKYDYRVSAGQEDTPAYKEWARKFPLSAGLLAIHAKPTPKPVPAVAVIEDPSARRDREHMKSHPPKKSVKQAERPLCPVEGEKMPATWATKFTPVNAWGRPFNG